jgi:serine/threonine protein kinase
MERVGLAPGVEIGGYTILAPLGSGGMGTVYRAVDGGGTTVALKLLHPHIGADPAARERLRREVAALQRLRSPGVAAVLDAEADSTEAFLVTELIPGKDLAEYVRLRGPLDATALHRVADRSAETLAAVHRAGVVHRDLKPSNLVLGPQGPVLIDFGVAQSVDETRLTSAGFVVGTPGYLAPELIGGAEPTPDTDWWGWAALLVFAATGRAPFGVRPLEAVLARTQEGDADLRGLGPITAGALWDALAPEPADRATPAEVVAALAEAELRGEVFDPEATEQPVRRAAPTTVVYPAAEPETAAYPAAGPETAAYPPVAPESEAYPQTAVYPATRSAAWDRPGQDPAPVWPEPVPALPPAPPTPPRRIGSLLALGLLTVAGAAVRPGITLLVLLPLVLLARTVGSVVAATLRRRERVGARRSDTARGVIASPWHLLRSVVTVLPSLLVSAALVTVVGGVGWWVLHDGGTADTAVEGGLLAVTAVIGLIALWWGPGSRSTREGARWALGAVAPGRWGAGVLVLLVLAVAAFALWSAARGDPVDFTPFGSPPVSGS